MWTTRDYFGEIYQMILKGLFKKLSLQTCIAILASSFVVPPVPRKMLFQEW